MGEKETKIERLIKFEELPQAIRELADKLEGINNRNDGVFPENVASFKKMKLSIKRRLQSVELEVKIKNGLPPSVKASAEKGEISQKSGKPGYKSLKKKMKADFKIICRCIENNQLPPEVVVESFLHDSSLMITYPDKGKEYYKEYLNACREFIEAYKQEDIELLREKCSKLAHLKERCHAVYK
ncbi:MAG: GAK system XXXCH domain-containing protein [candidate division Zixibacteria bacterium]|nr:GAK system XXXCH domain-containing protein [candidate division Zixibacteria bacterium]